MGGALQPRGPAGGGAAAWRRSADPLRRCGAAAHSGRSPAGPGTHAGRHRDVVVAPAATGLALGRRWSADHQHLHDLAGVAPSRSWQKSRTWCDTGVVVRKRKWGVFMVSDPDAGAKKS